MASFSDAFDHLESCDACKTGECAEGTRLFQRAHELLMQKTDPTPPDSEAKA